MTLIVNSSAGNSIFDVNGNAINNTTYKPNILGGAAARLGASNENLDNATVSLVEGTGTTVSSLDKLVPSDVENVFTNTKGNNLATVLKITNTSSGMRESHYDFYSGAWDSGYPTTTNVTSATNIANDNSSNKTSRITIGDGVIPTDTIVYDNE